jgi:stage II sporulation protein D
VGEPVVRVQIVDGAPRVLVGSTGPCQLIPSTGESVILPKLEEAPWTASDAGLQAGVRFLPGARACRILAGPGSLLRVEGKHYPGELVVLSGRTSSLRVVNHVRLEVYLGGVLGGEMPLKWPDAALEAQSIAARTYALWHSRAHTGEDHDLKADARSQVYTGVAGSRARVIVQATCGRVLTYEGQVFEAYYSSTCGGETASAVWVFGGPPIAPFRGGPCPHCASSPHARWEKKVPAADLAQRLASYGVKPPVTRVEALTWPRGSYVREVVVSHAGGESRLPGTKFRVALGLKSTAFEVATGADSATLVVTGRGWGHGVGLCQWGARGAADAGLDAQRILEWYYPGAAIQRLYE